MKHLNKWQFYLLSFTWGLPLSLLGVIVCGVLVLCGYPVKQYGHCCYIAIGKEWGGLEMGWFYLISQPEHEFTKKHELGHAYQNACIYGWFMPILVVISAARYWMQRLGMKINYYAWWFEARANEIGNEIMGKGGV